MRQLTSPKRRPLSVWELPKLLQSVHRHRKTSKKPVRKRAHFGAILAFVHRSRFAVASQIQRRFSKFLPSDRTARRHLAEMESFGYLDVVDTNNTSPLWPKVYFVTRHGLAMLRQALEEKGQEWSGIIGDRRRSNGTSAQHVLHEIFITEFLLMARETASSRDDLEILTVQRRSLAKHNAFQVVVAGRKTRLQPDGMFLYRQDGKGMMCCFLELDLDSMSIRQMEAKLRRYQIWGESTSAQSYVKDLYRKHGATVPKATFRIHVVTGSRDNRAAQRRAVRLSELISKQFASISGRIRFATSDQLKDCSPGECLTGAFWQRPCDFRDKSTPAKPT